MRRFFLDLLRATLAYEVGTFGGLMLFMTFAPLFGYLPYEGAQYRAGTPHFPALGWSDFWGNAWRVSSFGLVLAIIALLFAIPCAALVVVASRLTQRRTPIRLFTMVLFAVATFLIIPGMGWYVGLSLPAMWVAIGCSALSGCLVIPRWRLVSA